MKSLKASWIIPTLLGVLTLIAWALIIWVALHVSTIVLDTLDMIVELAAISP